jgi:hypothetical protein
MRLATPIVAALLLALAACGGGGGASTPTGPGNPAQASHNAGRNCLQCHGFTLAGTVYRTDGSTHPGAQVRITTQPDGGGDVVLSLTADASGNFHTNQAVSWGQGLYADVTGTSGSRQSMETPVTGGACNSCHDSSQRIRVD